MRSAKSKHWISLATLGLLVFLAAGSSEDKAKPEKGNNAVKKSLKESREVLRVVLACQSPDHRADRVVIGVYESKADVIAYSSGGIFDEGTVFNAALRKTDAFFYITHPYYGKGFSIDRTSLELYRAKEWSGVTSKPFTMANRDNCSIAPSEAFQSAVAEHKEHLAVNKLKRERELEALKANRKI